MGVEIKDFSAIKKSIFDANTILKADSNNVPVKLDVAEQRLIGRITGGNIAALTAAQILTFLNLSDALTYKGVIDCSGNPDYPAADAGDYYKVSVAGLIGGASGLVVELGDCLICTADSTASGDQATVGIFWNVLQTNIDLANPGPIGQTTPDKGAFTELKASNVKFDHNVETLAANKTLIITNKVIQKLDPDGTDRNILLPAENTATDLVFLIYNMSGEVGEDLYIQNDAAGALVTIGYGQIGICTCDGTTWKAIAIASVSEISTLNLRVKEENASALIIGQPVYVSGATGAAFPKVGLADCDDSTKVRVRGLAAEAISQNNTGYIRTHGVLEGINSTKGNAVNPNSEDWAAGDQLWLSTTAGGLTNVRPTSGRSVKIGIALTVEGANSKILVAVFENPIWATAASGEDIVQRMGDSAGANKISYRDYGNNEVASIDSDGLRSYADYKTIYIDAAEFIPCTHDGALQGTYEEPTNDIDLDIFLFEGGATPQRIICKTEFDENWDRGVIIGAKVKWNSESGSTAGDTVEWRIKMGAVGDGDAIDAALGTRQVISDTLLANDGADWQRTAKTPNITVAGSPAIGDAILIEIDRNGPGADTMAEKARFQGVTLQIKLSGAIALWT